MAIFLPFTRSWTLNVLGPTLQPLPSTSMYSCRVPSGRRSPTLIVIAVLLVGNSGCCGCDAAEACERHPGRDEEAADAAIHEPDVPRLAHHLEHARGERRVARHHDHVDGERGGRE